MGKAKDPACPIIKYFDEKRIKAGFKTHAALARAAWPELGENAGDYWKRLRHSGGYKKSQKFLYNDFVALCKALNIDIARTQIEIEQIERTIAE
jgi:hypothetical protein